MSELERALARLGTEVDYPPTPDLASAVTARLRSARPPGSGEAGRALLSPARRWRLGPGRRRLLQPAGWRESLALALVLLLVLASAAFAALPSVRDAVLELLGLQGSTVERRAELPVAPELRPLRLGARVPLEDAENELGFTPLLPGDQREPDAVFVRRDIPGGELSLAYRPTEDLPEAASTGLGLLVSQFRGDLLPEWAKSPAPARGSRSSRSTASPPSGSRERRTSSSTGREAADRDLRIAANVLLVQRGDLLVRLEDGFGPGQGNRDSPLALIAGSYTCTTRTPGMSSKSLSCV